MKSDIEIAQANEMEHIRDIASKLKISEDEMRISTGICGVFQCVMMVSIKV